MKPITLDVLTAPGCTHCHEFLTYWETVAAEWPTVTMKEISIITPEGQELVGKYQIFASPGIILNGEVFATGGFNKEKLNEKLKELAG
jgi:glutaredoxin